jgi:hypothetical protein
VTDAKKTTEEPKKTTGIKEVMNYFGMKSGEFMTQWRKLSDQDKADLRGGVLNGTLTY